MDIKDMVRVMESHSSLTGLIIENLTVVNTWHGKINYSPRRIEFQKRIADTLYKSKKYYLD